MKTVFSAIALAVAFLASPASAQTYVGVGVGSSSLSGFDGPVPGLASIQVVGGNANKTSSKLLLGYQFTPAWGLEAQYSMLGNRDLSLRNQAGAQVSLGGSAKASQFSVAGTGTLPLAANFSLLGKLGFSNNSTKVTLPGVTDRESTTSLMMGVGVAYKLTSALSLRLEHENFGKMSKDDGLGGAVRGSSTSLGLTYAF